MFISMLHSVFPVLHCFTYDIYKTFWKSKETPNQWKSKETSDFLGTLPIWPGWSMMFPEAYVVGTRKIPILNTQIDTLFLQIGPRASRPRTVRPRDLKWNLQRTYVYLKVQTSAPLVFPPFFPRRGWVHRCPIENDNLGSIHKTVISQNALFYLNVLIPSWTFLIIMDADIKGAKAEALDNARRMVASYLQVRELRAMATETWYLH